jgi:flagellar hook-associated protein 2
MAETDVFSALNVGSGLNTSELIKNLVDAERVPKEEKINNSIEKAEVSISAIAELKNSISESNNVIKTLDGTEVFSGSSTNTV